MMHGCVNVVVQQGEQPTVNETVSRRLLELDTSITRSSAPTPGPHTTYPMEP